VPDNSATASLQQQTASSTASSAGDAAEGVNHRGRGRVPQNLEWRTLMQIYCLADCRVSKFQAPYCSKMCYCKSFTYPIHRNTPIQVKKILLFSLTPLATPHQASLVDHLEFQLNSRHWMRPENPGCLVTDNTRTADDGWRRV